MSPSEAWHTALGVIADFRPMAFWRMANGSAFWWIPGRSQLLADRFREEPFAYSEIVSVTVFDRVQIGREVLTCDWPAVRARLLEVEGCAWWSSEVCDAARQSHRTAPYN